jgi:hypothetical protein
MSDIYGSIKRGKGNERIALEVDGSLTPDQWDLFKEDLKALLKKHNSAVKIAELQIKRNTKDE